MLLQGKEGNTQKEILRLFVLFLALLITPPLLGPKKLTKYRRTKTEIYRFRERLRFLVSWPPDKLLPVLHDSGIPVAYQWQTQWQTSRLVVISKK